MKTLYFTLEGPDIIYNGMVDDETPATMGFYQCRFDLSDPSWIGCTILAEFNDNEAEILHNGICELPDKYVFREYFTIRVYGVRGKNYRQRSNLTIVRMPGDI